MIYNKVNIKPPKLTLGNTNSTSAKSIQNTFLFRRFTIYYWSLNALKGFLFLSLNYFKYWT